MRPTRLLGGPRKRREFGNLGSCKTLEPSDLGDNRIMLKRGSSSKWGNAREYKSEGLMVALIMTIITA